MQNTSIYTYKEESSLCFCLFVLHAFGHGTSKCNQTLQGSSSHPGGGQRLLFVEKNIGPPPAKGPPVYLTNEITAFGSIEELLSSTLWADTRHVPRDFRGCWAWICGLFASKSDWLTENQKEFSCQETSCSNFRFREKSQVGAFRGGEFELGIQSPWNLIG